MAEVTRVTLFEREVRERLSEPAIELLLDGVKLTAEGNVARGKGGAPMFFGTAMYTLDVERLSGLVREPCDERAARKVADLCGRDSRLQKRLQKLAEQEVERLAGRSLRSPSWEVRVRAQGTTVLIDLEIEGALDATRPR